MPKEKNGKLQTTIRMNEYLFNHVKQCCRELNITFTEFVELSCKFSIRNDQYLTKEFIGEVNLDEHLVNSPLIKVQEQLDRLEQLLSQNKSVNIPERFNSQPSLSQTRNNSNNSPSKMWGPDYTKERAREIKRQWTNDFIKLYDIYNYSLESDLTLGESIKQWFNSVKHSPPSFEYLTYLNELPESELLNSKPTTPSDEFDFYQFIINPNDNWLRLELDPDFDPYNN